MDDHIVNDQSGLQELWKYALSAEVEASQLYYIATGKTHSREIKRLLHSLSKEEEGHFLELLKMCNQISGGGGGFQVHE